MAAAKNDILQGTLTLLVLKTLASSKRMHGYAITTHVQRVSGDLLRVEEGSLYPALHRMEQQGSQHGDLCRAELQTELPQLHELSLPGARAVRR